LKIMSGIIFYNGPSLIDGSPIVGIAIDSSKNRKTGGLIQCYIIRSNIAPLDASKTGADVSICGSCKHRGMPTNNPMKKQAEGRGCYVNLGQGPTIVYKGLKRGIYPQATPEQAQAFTAGQGVRLGAYGDPAAIPKAVWDRMILAKASFWTGYTHNLKVQPSMSDLCMVSADNQQQSASAKSHGRRSFRVIPLAQWKAKGKAAVSSHEILCPASAEAGSRVTCDSCKLCNGTKSKGKSIAIVAHGSGAKYA
jgi:hypothetical protein